MENNLNGTSAQNFFFEDFESYGAWPSPSGVTQAGGWYAGPGNELEILSENFLFGNGGENKVLEVEGSAGGASVYRDIATQPGEQYTMSLAYSPRSDYLGDSTIGVYWEGELVGTLASDTVGMQMTTFNLTANNTEGTSRLEFRALDGNGGGGVIDNVGLQPLAVPGSGSSAEPADSTVADPVVAEPAPVTDPDAGTDPVEASDPSVDPTVTDPTTVGAESPTGTDPAATDPTGTADPTVAVPPAVVPDPELDAQLLDMLQHLIVVLYAGQMMYVIRRTEESFMTFKIQSGLR